MVPVGLKPPESTAVSVSFAPLPMTHRAAGDRVDRRAGRADGLVLVLAVVGGGVVVAVAAVGGGPEVGAGRGGQVAAGVGAGAV